MQTPQDRAQAIVDRLAARDATGVPDLVEGIATALAEEREQTKAWEATARILATALEHLTPSLKSDSRLTQLNKARGTAALRGFRLMVEYHTTLPAAPQEPGEDTHETSHYCLIYETAYGMGTVIRAPRAFSETAWHTLVAGGWADYGQAEGHDLDSFPYWLAERHGWEVLPAVDITLQ